MPRNWKSTSVSGWNADSGNILDLLWLGGNSKSLVKLTIGVQTTEPISDWPVRLRSGGPGVNINTSGGGGGNEYSIDGSSDNANNRGSGFNPAPEFVQAMKMETSGFDASQGYGTGISIYVMTRFGTNDFHGTLREGHYLFAGVLIAGGFQLTGIQEYQAGALVTWPSTIYYSGTDYSSICSTGPHYFGQWFHRDGFTANNTLTSNTGQARVFPSIVNGYGGCRGDSMKRVNLSAQRDFKLKEGLNLQLRGDMYNVANRSQFGLPNTTATSTDFGKVTSTINGGGGGGTTNRSMQVQARLTF